MQETKFTSEKRVFIVFLFSRNAKMIHTDQRVMQPFRFCLERNNSQTFPCTNSNWYNLLRLMLFIRYDKWKTLFFIKVYFFLLPYFTLYPQ